MRDYKEVVSQRYDRQIETDFSPRTTLEWMSSQLRISQVFHQVLKRLADSGLNLADARVLEVGCGGGRWTRFIAEITGQPANIIGLDLSEPRIEHARRMNPAIRYRVADVVETPIGDTVDIAVAISVFMHFESEDSIRKALRNVWGSLSENGAFIFFDAWADSHFAPSGDSDSQGFRPDEIIQLARSEGFSPRFKLDVFRIFPGSHHSEQYYRFLPSVLIRFFEIVCPTKPGNFFIVFDKECERK